MDQLDSTISADLMLNSHTIGFEQMSNGRPLFINADRALLVGDMPIIFEPDRAVIEILETVEAEDLILDVCRILSEKEFKFALDGVVEWDERFESLISFCTYVKIDIREVANDKIRSLIERFKDYNISLLAEKVETWAEIERCDDLGFDLFQRYALSRPTIIEGRTIEPTAIAY